ncbi:sugar (and other) transporter family protein [Bacillus cereus ATCC 4342]|uniref:MFS transporter n=1 Tax=Bacillus tropicus TaxID=2026188 RepID=UPI0001A01739|nr:MFS transporter [Bacillus tropicus]AJH74694.1 sugar (and other) transporter family protein [Bacillus cereus ATCC 4342]EEK85607.1 Multidrug resistance protein [Bacillus cereus ATCC 4342]KFM88051.1 sugar (and other) transporter family protein [Bacillus cereus ATCC 4342]MDR4453923.1 MFS transporter [Bacillus tropicus]QKH54204.1 MFS transporter [Bacillus tropicus]
MKKIMAVFFLIMFVIGTDTFLISPLLPSLREKYDVTVELSGWLVSAYALGYALFALIAGPISDGFNRKKVMIFGLFSFSIFTFLCGLASSFELMLIFRFLSGISAAFLTPQVWASIPILLPPNKVLRGMGIATAGLSVSQMLGIPIGSYLASINWNTPFFIISIFSLLLLIPTFLLVPSIQPTEKENKTSIFKNYQGLLSSSKVRKTFFAYFIFQLGNFCAFSFLGTWLSDDYHFSVSQVGTAMLILGLGNTLGSLLGANVIQKIGELSSLIYGMIILSVFYSVLAYLPNILMVEVTFLLMFLFTGMIFPLLMSLLQSLSSTARGTIASLSNTVMYSGTTIGGYIGGILYGTYGSFAAIGFFTTAMFLLSLILFITSGVINKTRDISVSSEAERIVEN